MVKILVTIFVVGLVFAVLGAPSEKEGKDENLETAAQVSVGYIPSLYDHGGITHPHAGVHSTSVTREVYRTGYSAGLANLGYPVGYDIGYGGLGYGGFHGFPYGHGHDVGVYH